MNRNIFFGFALKKIKQQFQIEVFIRYIANFFKNQQAFFWF
jgi:hypothetical protein